MAKKYSHWIEAFLHIKPYFLKVFVGADKTTCVVEDWRNKQICTTRELPFAFNTVKAQIGEATGLKGYELDLFIADHRRRLEELPTVGTKGQWDYAEPVLLKWFYLLSGSVTQLRAGLAPQYYGLRVEIYTPFARLCKQWGYMCYEIAIIYPTKEVKNV